MEILELNYTKRFNIGNYEHEEYKIVARPSEEEKDTSSLFLSLKKEIAMAHANQKVSDTPISSPKETGEVEPSTKKKTAKKATKVKSKEKEVELISYDRANELHTKLFKDLIRELFPDWTKEENARKFIKQLSIDSVGSEFLNSEAEIVDTFRKTIVDLIEKFKSHASVA